MSSDDKLITKHIDHDDFGVYPPDDYTGIWEVYWPNGQIKYRAELISGKEHGDVRCWWDNGNLAQQGTSGHGKPVGHWIDYHHEGPKTYEGIYDDGHHGVWHSDYLDGSLMSVENWQHGEQHGRAVSYDADGNVEVDGEYRDGEPYSGSFYIDTGERQPDGTYWVVKEFRDGVEVGENNDLSP